MVHTQPRIQPSPLPDLTTLSLDARTPAPAPACASANDLPAELLARILRLAQEGDSPRAQQQTRFRFERVCKAWYMCDNKWPIVAIRGLHQAVKLLKLVKLCVKAVRASQDREAAGLGRASGLPIEPIAAQVKTVYVDVKDAEEGTEYHKLANPLGRFVAVDTVEIRLEGLGFCNERGVGLGSIASAALAKHKGVTWFKISTINAKGAALIADRFLQS